MVRVEEPGEKASKYKKGKWREGRRGGEHGGGE